jgi:hydrogenase-4 component E
MTTWIDIFLLFLVLTDFRLLASSRLGAIIQTTVFQAVSLSACMLLMAVRPVSIYIIVLAIVTFTVKGIILPWLLRRAMREADVQREVSPMIGYSASVLIGVILLGLSFIIFMPMKAAVSGSAFLMPGALLYHPDRLMMFVSRKNALTQVAGYLVMENGIYAFGIILAVEEPLLVEMGVLLDEFVAVFVMGITAYQISREFDHIDTDRLSELKD